MLSRLDDSDWDEVFKYANSPVRVAPPGMHSDVSEASFDREDVSFIVAMADGFNDGDPWVGLFKLKDGRWASIRASCDYTGWG